MVFVFNSDFFNWHTSKLFQKTIAVYLDDTLHPKCVSNSMHEPLRICSKVTKWSIASKWCEINYIGVLKVRNLIYRNELEVWFCQNVLYCNTCHHEGTKYIGFINHHSKCSTIICLQNQHHINLCLSWCELTQKILKIPMRFEKVWCLGLKFRFGFAQTLQKVDPIWLTIYI